MQISSLVLFCVAQSKEDPKVKEEEKEDQVQDSIPREYLADHITMALYKELLIITKSERVKT